VTQGYRWITVDGPFACDSEQDVQRITGHRTDAVELQMIENLQAYYLIPGTLVQVVQDDAAAGMTQDSFGRDYQRPMDVHKISQQNVRLRILTALSKIRKTLA